jgi:Protein of unknown function (DUF2637)
MPAEGAVRAARDRDRIDRAIEHASWLGALATFAYGAALSFDVLHTIALAAGLSPLLAWLWPLGFETFMAVPPWRCWPSGAPDRAGRPGIRGC